VELLPSGDVPEGAVERAAAEGCSGRISRSARAARRRAVTAQGEWQGGREERGSGGALAQAHGSDFFAPGTRHRTDSLGPLRRRTVHVVVRVL